MNFNRILYRVKVLKIIQLVNCNMVISRDNCLTQTHAEIKKLMKGTCLHLRSTRPYYACGQLITLIYEGTNHTSSWILVFTIQRKMQFLAYV